MKILKKLLPIATVASTASIVVPLATSCAGMSDFDYTPSIPMHETQTYDSMKEAMGEYYSQVKENHQILIQDYYWTVAQREKTLKAQLINDYKDVSISFSVDASISLMGMSTQDAENIYYLSCDIKVTENVKYTDEDTASGKKITTINSMSTKANNQCERVAFRLERRNSMWSVILYIPSKGIDDWSIKQSGKTCTSQKITSEKISDYQENKAEFNQKYDKDNPIPSFGIEFQSYYFQNVKIK